ncbi:MAG: bis(5'-nucleosyl)-tetraphosphatase (symmetrical) YqeK [Clostridia bacterium]|nr:bis(5'-nucleosyl)-tetraphosphatase (symmetrical) YqeK [Clostridia bacterium]
MKFTEKQLELLRDEISEKMSEKRFFHTAEVEKMAARIGEIYAPDKIDVLRAAGLLHDITKEYSTEKQLQICREFGIITTKQDILTPKTFHAKTAAVLIPVLYPDFADEEVVSAVRWHTTGNAEMTLLEKIVYLADYIDESRKFDDCVKLRRIFWDAKPEKMSEKERDTHLTKTLLVSFDMTLASLISENAPISDDTFKARNSLVLSLCEEVN